MKSGGDGPEKSRTSRPAPRSSRPRKTPPREKGKPARRVSSALRWTLGVSLVLAAAAAFLFLFVYPSMHGPGAGRDVELVIPGDESPPALAARLETAGLLSSPRLFAAYLRVVGALGRDGAAHVVRGAHLLTDDLSPRELLNRLERSPSAARVKLTFPEGWTRWDFARRLQERHVCTARSFLDATADAALLAELRIDAPSAEGFLFPATYDLPSDGDARDVVRRMKTEFDRRWAVVEQRRASGYLDLATSLGWGMRQIVTLASMVEKEAVMDDERATIASVFVNRLRDPSFTPKLLQCDPTAGYGCLASPAEIPTCAAFTGKITHDLITDGANPYNTYKHEGLPPGPICNPGLKSLEAAMQPATTRFFYFVARGEGRHTFSETYAGHSAAIHGRAPGAPSTSGHPSAMPSASSAPSVDH